MTGPRARQRVNGEDVTEPEQTPASPVDEEQPLHRWAVTYLATVSKTVMVEATDMDGAWEAAEREFDAPHLCYSCSRHMDMGDWMPDEGQWGTVDEGPVDGTG